MVSTTSFSPNTKAQSSQVNDNFQNITQVLKPTFEVAVGGTLTTGTSKTAAIIVPQAMTIIKVYAYVKTPSSGQAIIVDINKNGSTIWSNQANRVEIAAAGQTGSQTSFNTISLSEGDILTFDIDQVGSGTAGADITIAVICSL
jgi:hypothetical protein